MFLVHGALIQRSNSCYQFWFVISLCHISELLPECHRPNLFRGQTTSKLFILGDFSAGDKVDNWCEKCAISAAALLYFCSISNRAGVNPMGQLSHTLQVKMFNTAWVTDRGLWNHGSGMEIQLIMTGGAIVEAMVGTVVGGVIVGALMGSSVGYNRGDLLLFIVGVFLTLIHCLFFHSVAYQSLVFSTSKYTSISPLEVANCPSFEVGCVLSGLVIRALGGSKPRCLLV